MEEMLGVGRGVQIQKLALQPPYRTCVQKLNVSLFESVSLCFRLVLESPPPLMAGDFDASLGARNGAPALVYSFKRVRCEFEYNYSKGRRLRSVMMSHPRMLFDDMMISGCSRLGQGWKPLCESYLGCNADPYSVYIGQDADMGSEGKCDTCTCRTKLKA